MTKAPFLASLALVSALQAPAAPRSKKLIATGWDKVDSARFRQHAAAMQRRPFDGVMMAVTGTRPDGTSCVLRSAHSDHQWEREWFSQAVADLKATALTSFTDNFVSIGANPGNVDWFDDTGWQAVVDHWATAAWISHQVGFRGLLFDPEPYAKPFRQFDYNAQAGAGTHTFEQYAVKARERGRQVMNAVTAEYPDITVFCYFMNSVNLAHARMPEPQKGLRTSSYGLFPAFIDGWLDVVPPDVVLVDGCESAYRYNSQIEYLSAAVAIKGDAQNLVAPENRAAYRAQVQVSFGVYLDAYWNPPTSPWHIDVGGDLPARRLLANVRHALAACDEFVWIYGEKFRWWPTPNARVNAQHWPEALPGCENALALARDPHDFGRQAAAQGKGEVVSRNGDFGSATAADNEGRQLDWRVGNAPAGWLTWQLADSKGTFSWDQESGRRAPGCALATGVGNGCFIQSCEGDSGTVFALRGFCRASAGANAWIRARWQTEEGKWVHQGQDVVLWPHAADETGWSEIYGTVTVPEGAARLVVLLGMACPNDGANAVRFDDVSVWRLGPFPQTAAP